VKIPNPYNFGSDTKNPLNKSDFKMRRIYARMIAAEAQKKDNEQVDFLTLMIRNNIKEQQ
tara:strand:- start:866 stop:1045 length:180 start_codon:yes stop_codon:yes gene_type:complete